MSGWDKPSHSDRPDDGSDGRGERRRESWERPFPGAPRDRPPAPEIDRSKLRPFEEIAAERRGPEAYREYLDKTAAQRERLDEKPASGGSPERGRESPPEIFALQVSRARLREIYATSTTTAELDAAMAAEKARLAQDRPASSETAERAGTRPDADADKSSEKDRPGITQDPDTPRPLQAEASAGNGEGTRATEKTENTDKPEATDRNAERVKELETELAETRGELAETKDELTETKVQLAETKGDVAEGRAELAEERLDRRRLTNVVADQADEIKRLRAQLEARDNPAEAADAPTEALDRNRADGNDQDESLSEKKSERSHWPSTETVATAAAGSGILETFATHGHLLTTWEGTVATATASFGVAAYGLVKKKIEAHEERKAAKNADRPED